MRWYLVEWEHQRRIKICESMSGENAVGPKAL